MTKDVKKLVKEAVRQGWIYEGTTKRSHVRLRGPDGRLVIVASTPSDRRSLKNAVSRMAHSGFDRSVLSF